MTYVYDIEVLSNCFVALFIEVGQTDKIEAYAKADIDNDNLAKTKILKSLKHELFIIFNQANDLTRLKRFLSNKHTLIGYNNLSYDDIMIDYMYHNYRKLISLNTDAITSTLKEMNDMIIESRDMWFEVRKFHNIPYNRNYTSIDLMRLNYLYKSFISLKQVSINLKWYNIEDYVMPPYTQEQADELYGNFEYTLDEINNFNSFDKKIHSSELDHLVLYCYNDVFITNKLLVASSDELQSRINISKTYGLNVLSDARSSVANKVMKHLYAKYTGLSYEDFVNQRTWRKYVVFANIINPKVKFKTPEFNEFLNRLFRITVNPHLNSQFKENVNFKEMNYTLGLGGLHSKDVGAIFKESPTHLILDCDVNSYYPYSIVLYKIKASHLSGTIITIINDLLKLRINYKQKGDKSNADIYKIIINAIFGKYGDADSFFKDDLAMYTVTLNNQLFLLMLIEDFELNGIRILSANTDGITAYVPIDKLDLYNKLIEDWSNNTGFSMEVNKYKEYIRTSVNHYIVVVDGGSKGQYIKMKGEFDYNKYKDFTSGYNSPIVPYALYKYYVDHVPVEETIRNHTDILDFCISQKTGRNFVNEFHQIVKTKLIITKLSKNIRYYASTKGGVILKRSVENDKLINVLKGQTVQVLNKLKNISIEEYNINYNYYVSKCNDIMTRVNNSKTTFMKKHSGTLFDELDNY
jgi:predicted transcriptional regulator